MSGRIWTPRPDQQQVLEFIGTRSRSAVWAGVGAGKTVMALTWLAQKMDDCAVARALIVAPKLVAQHGWPLQVQLWGHLEHLGPEMRVLDFADLGMTRGPTAVARAKASTAVARAKVSTAVASVSKTQGLEFRDKRATKSHLLSLPGRVHVCSWEAFPWIVKALGKNWPYDCVIFDEASFLRDQQSDRGKAARHAVHRSGVVDHVLELTASPAANHEEAVFAQLDLVQPGLLGATLTEFRETFCIPDSRNWSTGQVYRWKVAPNMRAEFQRRCASVAVSVPASLSVPLIEAPVWVEPGGAAKDASRAFLADSVWGTIAAGSAAVVHAKLRMLASGFVYDENEQPLDLDTVKLDRLVELVDLIGEPVVLAYQWKHELARLRKAFGSKLGEIRDSGAREAFLAGKLPILALHPASAGHGVDGLQHVSRHLIWTSVPEDRELYDQTNGRLHRHGTKADTVMCHVLVARGTREQDIWDEVLPGKATVQDLILRAARVAV